MLNDQAWLHSEVEALTTRIKRRTLVEWSNERRYLPTGTSPLPGKFKMHKTPYLREMAEALEPDSGIHEITCMKGVQIGLTTLIENWFGWLAEEITNQPVLLMTASDILARKRLEDFIVPMFDMSDMNHLIQSSDAKNQRKTGKSRDQLTWFGGGYVRVVGALSERSLRSISFPNVAQDESDSFPGDVGGSGDPAGLADGRTKAFSQTRKIMRVSTPLVAGQSRIEKYYLRGDQRQYHVPCMRCGKHQELRFKMDKPRESAGEVWGMMWETENDRLVLDSVRYRCRYCFKDNTNAEKVDMLPAGKWVPTAVPRSPAERSYHLPGLLSPTEMLPWADIVLQWLDAWDEETNKVKDVSALQVFYNNVLAKPFELATKKVKPTQVSKHRRQAYKYGEIPNKHAAQFADGKIGFLTAAVDVHERFLAVAVFGWTRGSRCYLIDYWRLEGDVKNPDCKDTWGRLDEIGMMEYTADDGRVYPVEKMFVDSGWEADLVYRWCEGKEFIPSPIKGASNETPVAMAKTFRPMKTPLGTVGWMITDWLHKDRLSRALGRDCDGMSIQPQGHFNVPRDATDAQLRELTREYKGIETQGKNKGKTKWIRPGGARQELWDLGIYASCAKDTLAWGVCIEEHEYDEVDWDFFWDVVEDDEVYYRPGNVE